MSRHSRQLGVQPTGLDHKDLYSKARSLGNPPGLPSSELSESARGLAELCRRTTQRFPRGAQACTRTNASFHSPAVFYLFGMVPMPTRHMEDLSISCECESAPRACRTKKHPYSTRTTSLHQLGTCISSMLQQCPLQHMKELSISCECGSAHQVALFCRKQPAPGRLVRAVPVPKLA